MNYARGPQKPAGLITSYLRHFVFLRVLFSSEGESKIPAISETELFLTLANV